MDPTFNFQPMASHGAVGGSFYNWLSTSDRALSAKKLGFKLQQPMQASKCVSFGRVVESYILKLGHFKNHPAG